MTEVFTKSEIEAAWIIGTATGDSSSTRQLVEQFLEIADKIKNERAVAAMHKE